MIHVWEKRTHPAESALSTVEEFFGWFFLLLLQSSLEVLVASCTVDTMTEIRGMKSICYSQSKASISNAHYQEHRADSI